MKKPRMTTSALAEIERALAEQDRSLQAAYRGLAQKEASAVALPVGVIELLQQACSAASDASDHKVELRASLGIRC